MKSLHITLLIATALVLASCHKHIVEKQIVKVELGNPDCTCGEEWLEGDTTPQSGDNPHCRCGVEETLDESAISPQDDIQSCGCGVKGAQTGEYPPGVSIDVIEDAIRGMTDMIAPQCRCGLDIKDEDDAGLDTEQRKAILEQGLQLLDRDANLQPEAGEGEADRAGEPPGQ